MKNSTLKPDPFLVIAACFILAGCFVLGSGIVLWQYATRETWPRLRKVDPSLQVLDNPQRLLSIATTFVGRSQPNEHPADATIDTRHEALRALLQLQQREFGIQTKPHTDGTGIDHVYIERVSSKSKNYVRLLATPSRYADRAAPESDYWTTELLTFDKSGRLVKRVAYYEDDPERVPEE